LTAGIVATLGNVQKIPYIEALNQQPKSASSQAFDLNKADADTALTLNTHDAKQQINNGINKGLTKAQQQAQASATAKIAVSPAPPIVKAQLETKANSQIATKFKQTKDTLYKKQAQFSHDVKYAFSNSLRIVFYIAAGLMVLAFIAAVFIREKELRHGSENATPGVA
jgi:type IV secretory pathway VirJ component